MDESLALPRSRSLQPAVDHQGFLGAVREALALHTKSEGLAPEYVPVLTEDYPREREGEFDHSFDVILFTVVSSQMGATDPRQTRRPNGPVLRENRPHPTKARYRLATYAWWEDSIVQFSVLAKSNKRANELATWFHRFLMRYAHAQHYFSARGVSLFRYRARLEDRPNKDFGQELSERRIQYQIRLEFLDSFELKELESVHLAVTAENASGTPETFEYDLPPAAS
jgi:hypothetical protein